jgi:peroxiredoxin
MHKKLKKNIAIFTSTMLSLLITTSVLAKLTSIEVGVKVGEQAPKITAVNIKGQSKTIKELSGEKGLILAFNRSADWCHFCQAHLIEMNEYADKFTALGYNQAAISYDSVDILKKFGQERKIKFTMLSDEQSATFVTYGILNKQYKPGDMDYGIPYPGVIVINAQGQIISSHFYQGYKKRVKFEQLYQQLK